MSKFLPNLLLQNSKALVNSKIQFLIQKSFFLAFGPANLAAHSASGQPAQRPRRPRRPKQSRPAHPARASVASSREIRFPFRITPSRVGRLSLVSPSTGPHLSDSPPPSRRLTPVRNPSRHRFPAPLPPSFYSPPSSLSPLNPLQTEP
jgi:hypothetical protein